MAISMGIMGSAGSSSSMLAGSSGRRVGVRCAVAGRSLRDHYHALRVQPGASEKDVKKAFRQLALQYHPDVCKGRDCSVQFHRINQAYDVNTVISNLRAAEEEEQQRWQSAESGEDMWEEWMGWEGAGIRDYSSHINPYI